MRFNARTIRTHGWVLIALQQYRQWVLQPLLPEKSDKVLVSPARKILSRFCHITKIDLSLGSGYEQVSGRRQQKGAIRLQSLHVPEMVGCEGGCALSQLGDQEWT